jgi:hypothetical protein
MKTPPFIWEALDSAQIKEIKISAKGIHTFFVLDGNLQISYFEFLWKKEDDCVDCFEFWEYTHYCCLGCYDWHNCYAQGLWCLSRLMCKLEDEKEMEAEKT